MGIIAVGMSVEERRSELKRMQGIATALLLAMTALLALTRSARFDLLWLPYLRAFAEAGMVGACADWFAVVALFRRPLGLPIPHTGIVPANQHRIAEALGRFVANNFLTRKSVNRKLAEIDVVGLLARWMADPKHSKAIAATCGRALPEILQSMPPGRIQEFAAVIARRSVETIPAAPAAAHLLEALWANGEAQALLDHAIVFAGETLTRNKGHIRKRVATEKPHWLPKWIDAIFAQRIVNGLISTIAEMRDVRHPWRRELQKATGRLIRSLAYDPVMAAKGEELKARLLADPLFLRQVEILGAKIEEGLAFDPTNRNDDIASALDSALLGLSHWLLEKPELIAALNRRFRLLILRTLPARRAEIGAYVAQVVHNWDDATLADRLELHVGKDLQYIRINGTLVGGLVGVLIFVIGRWIDGV